MEEPVKATCKQKNMRILSLLLFLGTVSCNQHNNFYQGVVTDTAGTPLAGVRVTEMYRENQTQTDAGGYFRLSKSPDWVSDLIFVKEGYNTDTIPTVWHPGGETTAYNFVNKDTTRVQLILAGKTDLRKDSQSKEIARLHRGLLQYLKEGENEDNLYSLFLTEDLDTLAIVLPHDEYLDSSAAGKMYNATWEYRLMTSGGDSDVEYQQAFMKTYTEIKAGRFR